MDGLLRALIKTVRRRLRSDEEVTVEEMAAKTGTISYEVLCGVSARVPRVYRVDGRVTVRSRFQ